MQTMSVVFHSRGLVLTWISGAAGDDVTTAPSFTVSAIGARQHAQYDSSPSVFPANGGIFEIAIDSIAHPAQQWNRPSRWTATWLG